MPSPIGHALGGLAAGVLISRRPGWSWLALFALLGVLADIDFLLPLQHRGPTHGVGAVLLVLLAGLAFRHTRLALAVALAYGTHLLFDWLGADSSTPRGIMAFWPLSTAFYVSDVNVFDSVDRRYWTDGFWTRNALAVLRELVLLGPVAAFSTYRIRAQSSARDGRPRPSA